jgi:hypothetical protein
MENQPIPGFGETALAQGWQGPITDPVLPAADPAPVIPAAGLLAPAVRDAVLAGRTGPAGRGTNPAPLAGSLTLILHAELDPVPRIRRRAQVMAESAYTGTRGLGVPAQAGMRLSNCYRRESGGPVIVVGNCYLTITGGFQGPYGRPPRGDRVGSGFCALSLGRYYPFPLQIVPKGKSLLGSGHTSGHPALDARYLTISPWPGRVIRPALARLPLRPGSQLPDMKALIGDELAGFLASGDRCAFAVADSMLICAILQEIRSAGQARQLAEETAEAAALLGR